VDETAALIVVELRDVRGVRMVQWTFDDQVLRRNQSVMYEVQWQPSPGTAPGIYVIEVGIFAGDWGRLRHWNDGTGVLLLQPLDHHAGR
jgi:hypothetical protein